MTSRGRLALALGCLTYLAAWAFGSKPLYPVALGLIAAAVLARLWTRLAGRPVELRRRLPAGERFAGDDVKVRLELLSPRRLPATLLLRERIGKLGERETPVARDREAGRADGEGARRIASRRDCGGARRRPRRGRRGELRAAGPGLRLDPAGARAARPPLRADRQLAAARAAADPFGRRGLALR